MQVSLIPSSARSRRDRVCCTADVVQSSGFDSLVSSFLLDLHSKSHELGYRSMQGAAFALFHDLVGFDSGLFALGNVVNGEPNAHDTYLCNQPNEMMASWERVKFSDPLAFAAMSSPGKTIAVSVTSPMYAPDACEPVRAHCRAYNIEHALCTSHIYADAGLFWVMSLYRSAASPAFTEDDRARTELLSTHLFAATRNARIRELRRSANIGTGPAQLSAIATTAGTVLDAEPGFAEVMRTEFPRWIGPTLPSTLDAELPGGTGRFVGARVVVRIDEAEGMRLIHVRPKVIADGLTQREREIAESFALGESHREIGEKLQIAPATVRRHLANLYEKLGVSSKAELDRMLRDAD